MNTSYFKKSFVSLLTLTSLMGASQGVFAMDTFEDDEGNPQPLQRVQSPEKTAPKPILLTSIPRDLFAAHVMPYVDAAAGVWFENIYLKQKGGKLPNCKGVIDVRTQLCLRTLTPFREVPICKLEEANKLATEIRTNPNFSPKEIDEKTREEVIRLGLDLYKKQEVKDSSFSSLCTTIKDLGEDRAEVCSATNRLVPIRIYGYYLKEALKSVAKLGNKRAAFLDEFGPFITKYIRAHHKCSYLDKLVDKAETMIPAMRLAKKYSLTTDDMYLGYLEDLLDLTVSFGDEGESVCAAAHPFPREGMHPIPLIKFVRAVHGLGKDRVTILDDLKTLLDEESNAKNILELAEILKTDFELTLTYAKKNDYVKTYMPFWKIRNCLRDIKLLGDKREQVCSFINDLVTDGEDRTKTIEHLSNLKCSVDDLLEILELIKNCDFINKVYRPIKHILIRDLVGVIMDFKKEEREAVCDKVCDDIKKDKQIIIHDTLLRFFKGYTK